MHESEYLRIRHLGQVLCGEVHHTASLFSKAQCNVAVQPGLVGLGGEMIVRLLSDDMSGQRAAWAVQLPPATPGACANTGTWTARSDGAGRTRPASVSLPLAPRSVPGEPPGGEVARRRLLLRSRNGRRRTAPRNDLAGHEDPALRRGARPAPIQTKSGNPIAGVARFGGCPGLATAASSTDPRAESTCAARPCPWSPPWPPWPPHRWSSALR